MVTKKRFRINGAYSKSLQNLIGVIRDNDEDMYMTDVVDLLNQLSEENEQLKNIILFAYSLLSKNTIDDDEYFEFYERIAVMSLQGDGE